MIGVVFVLLLHRIAFDWAGLRTQLREVAAWHLAAAVAFIYLGLWLRLLRWSVFCSFGPVSSNRTSSSYPAPGRTPPGQLMAPMSMGYTAVALFGRLADLVRPYLIARRIDRSLPSQIAVYAIERMFDLGAAAAVFSCALALTPPGLEHRERFVRVGLASLAGTLALALFAAAVRWKGQAIAATAGHFAGRFSRSFGAGAEEKILGFQGGLLGIRTPGEFALAAALSIAMWVLIGMTYWQTMHAFTGSPTVATVTFSRAMLLMAVSLGGSLVQLPILGWFTQIALLASAIHAFYGAPIEVATACGTLLLATTSLSILPAGLWFAWKGGVSLRAIAEESGVAARQGG